MNASCAKNGSMHVKTTGRISAKNELHFKGKFIGLFIIKQL